MLLPTTKHVWKTQRDPPTQKLTCPAMARTNHRNNNPPTLNILPTLWHSYASTMRWPPPLTELLPNRLPIPKQTLPTPPPKLTLWKQPLPPPCPPLRQQQPPTK